MGSNPTQGMVVCIVCVYSVFMLFYVQVEALRRADPPSKESYRLYIELRDWKSCQGPTKGVYNNNNNNNNRNENAELILE
jgi:hypothetical protein